MGVSNSKETLWKNCEKGNVKQVEANIAALRSDHYRPLAWHEATEKYHVEGRTALLIAVERGHEQVVKLLCENEASTSVQFIPQRMWKGVHGVVSFSPSSQKGPTPVQWAAHHGHASVLKVLLNAGADKDFANNMAATALFLAVQSGHASIVQMLCEAGADVNKGEPGSQATPLYGAAQDNREEAMKTLLAAGANTEACKVDGWTPLHVASKKGHVGLVRLLLGAGAALEANSATGATPLHIAAAHGQAAVATVLLEAGADTAAQDKNGLNPLSVAKKAKHDAVVTLLDGAENMAA